MAFPSRQLPSWAIIARKEFREIFRDRRTLMSVVIGPLVATPTLFALMGIFIGSQMEKARTQVYEIGVLNAVAAPGLLSALKALPDFKLHTDAGSRDQVEKAIKEHKFQAGIVLSADTQTLLDRGRTAPVVVLIDAGSDTSQQASSRLNDRLGSLGQQILAKRLLAEHLPADYAHPIQVTQQPIKSGGSAGTLFLTMMLPYILTLSAFSGAIYAAFDQVAGEKERGTLETLLISPASRRDIVTGKFVAVVGVCLITSILSVAGLQIAFSLPMKAMKVLAAGGMHLGPEAIGVCLLVMLPLSVLFAGLLLAVSTFARNQKEAQTYLAPMMMVVIVPMMASMFLGTDVSRMIAMVPILGASIILKQALTGSYDPVFILIAFAASVLYAGIALTIATRLFQSEGVLIKA